MKRFEVNQVSQLPGRYCGGPGFCPLLHNTA